MQTQAGDRIAALSAGVLFITATAASISATALSQPVLNHADYLARVSANANQVSWAAFFDFLAAGASVGIAISLYPVLKRWNAGLALGSVVFRAIEAVMYIVGLVCVLSLLELSDRFSSAVAADRVSVQAIADTLLNLRQEAILVGVLAFSLGALMYYYMFYRSRLTPRWLSCWGIAAIGLMMLACLLAWFNHNPVLSYTILALPIGVQEMVLAVWLIARGFSSSALQSRTASRVGTALAS